MREVYRAGDEVMARRERDWFHAEIVRLEPGGSYLVRWIKPKSGYVDRRPDTQRGNFSGF